jgi:hypothetical protein
VHCRMPATSPLASALQSRTGFNPPDLKWSSRTRSVLQRLPSRRFFFAASISLMPLDRFDRHRLVTVAQKPLDQQMQFLRQHRLRQHMDRRLAHGRNCFGRRIGPDATRQSGSARWRSWEANLNPALIGKTRPGEDRDRRAYPLRYPCGVKSPHVDDRRRGIRCCHCAP